MLQVRTKTKKEGGEKLQTFTSRPGGCLMPCDDCISASARLDAIEALLRNQGWALIRRAGVLRMVQMIRDECAHKNTKKTQHCKNGACAAGCLIWAAKE